MTILGARAFLPGSQVDLRPVRNLDALKGHEIDVRIIKLNMDRRNFMATTMGLATCFLASNAVYGKVFDVDEVTFHPQACACVKEVGTSYPSFANLAFKQSFIQTRHRILSRGDP